MARKQLARSSPYAGARREWESFLGLVPILDVSAVDPVLYQRCLAAVWRLRKRRAVSGEELRQACGLQFEEKFEFLLARLIRESILEPIIEQPFCFHLAKQDWTNPESGYAADQPQILIEITQREQTERLRVLKALESRLAAEGMSEKQLSKLEKERHGLQQLYRATWSQLSDAIGAEAADAIRKETEIDNPSKETPQFELPLEQERASDTEEKTMQRGNGTEQETQRATMPPAINSPDEPLPIPEELLQQLRAPLPAEAVSPNLDKPGLSVIKVIYVVERLNAVFGLNGWSVQNEVVESGRMVVVKAALTVPKYRIRIEQYGGNDNPDRGDAYKGACTDALSKCASYLGIGMDVYKGLHDPPRNGSRPQANGTQPGGARSAATGHSDDPVPPSRNGKPSGLKPTGLTSQNMAERFTSMRQVLGADRYNEVLGRHGYSEITDIPSLEKAREAYRALLEAFRPRFCETMKALGRKEYAKILRELRFKDNTDLRPEQAIQVFRYMEETLRARE